MPPGMSRRLAMYFFVVAHSSLSGDREFWYQTWHSHQALMIFQPCSMRSKRMVRDWAKEGLRLDSNAWLQHERCVTHWRRPWSRSSGHTGQRFIILASALEQPLIHFLFYQQSHHAALRTANDLHLFDKWEEAGSGVKASSELSELTGADPSLLGI